ncbi:hypothetical protein ACJX0J_020210, partial [Zea mays]
LNYFIFSVKLINGIAVIKKDDDKFFLSITARRETIRYRASYNLILHYAILYH